MGSSKQAQQNPVAKVVGRVMGGSTAAGDEHPTVDAFQLASRLITNGEYLQFRHDGGYERPEFWLSDGWTTVQANGWKAPSCATSRAHVRASYRNVFPASARWQFAGIRLANEAAR